MKKSKHIFRILMLLPVIFYSFYSRSDINNLTEPYRENTKSQYISEQFKIDKKGEQKFHITNNDWPYKIKLDRELLSVMLIFKYNDSVPIEFYRKSKLTFEIKAYSKYNNNILNRLVSANFIPSDKISLDSLTLTGVDYRDYHNAYYIGTIVNSSYEDIYIKLNILEGDSILNKATPRRLIKSLKIKWANVWAIS